MLSGSPYKIGLGPKILDRARLILGSLLLVLTIIIIAGIHQGVVSGDFDRFLLKPFREFAADFEKAAQPTPTPTPTPKPSTTPSPTAVPTSVKKSTPAAGQSQPVYSNCIRKNIREGEFASNKCYSEADYEDLNYYLQRYDSAKFSLSSAEGSMRITCNCRVQQECDFFKDSCERDKQQKSQAEADINNYRGIIQGIIARGK